MTHLESLQDIVSKLTEALADADKFDKGNASAGTRLRTAANDARKALQVLRTSVQETKNARKGG